MMFQELENPKRLNWVLEGSNLNTHLQSFYNFPRTINPERSEIYEQKGNKTLKKKRHIKRVVNRQYLYPRPWTQGGCWARPLQFLIGRSCHWDMFSTTCNIMGFVATPLWAKCEGEAHTPKSGNLESSGTPENSEDDLRSQTSLHQCAPGVIGKVLNCRCPKWPRMSHLDICNPSYGQEKGRESNWQFDSRPLKVRNRPVPDVRSRSATWRWKALFEGYKFGSDLVLI